MLSLVKVSLLEKVRLGKSLKDTRESLEDVWGKSIRGGRNSKGPKAVFCLAG